MNAAGEKTHKKRLTRGGSAGWRSRIAGLEKRSY